jgi:hypothetical protein
MLSQHCHDNDHGKLVRAMLSTEIMASDVFRIGRVTSPSVRPICERPQRISIARVSREWKVLRVAALCSAGGEVERNRRNLAAEPYSSCPRYRLRIGGRIAEVHRHLRQTRKLPGIGNFSGPVPFSGSLREREARVSARPEASRGENLDRRDSAAERVKFELTGDLCSGQ